VAPSSLNIFGADLYPAPFAQSITTFIPLRVKLSGKLPFKISIYLSFPSSSLVTRPSSSTGTNNLDCF
jgi:hypothetical protein